MRLYQELKRRYLRYKLATWCCWARTLSPICYLIYSKERCDRMEQETFEWADKFIEECRRKLEK